MWWCHNRPVPAPRPFAPVSVDLRVSEPRIEIFGEAGGYYGRGGNLTAFPKTKVERDGSGNSRLPQLPGGLAFPKSVPDCVFPKRSVEHGETGLLTVGGSAGFGMPSRFTEWPEMARYRPGSLAAARTQFRPFERRFWLPNSGHPFISLERPASGIREWPRNGSRWWI